MKRVLLVLVWILTATVIASAQNTFYYSHVVDGGLGSIVWKTTIFLTNPSSTGTTSGTVTFTKDSSNLALAGSPLVLQLTDESGVTTTASSFAFSIPPEGTRKLVSGGVGSAGQFASGFGTVTASAGTVSGTAVFSEFSTSGALISEAGVPAASAVNKQAIFVDTSGGYQVGVAYANPGPSATITLNLLNSAAVSVASTTQVLGSGNHTAAFTSQLFPTAPQLAVGTMQIVASSPLVAIALRFDPTLSKFTTLPPVTLTAFINPAVEWLQERPWLTPLTSIAKLLGSLQLSIG